MTNIIRRGQSTHWTESLNIYLGIRAVVILSNVFFSHFHVNDQWIARTQSTTNKNYAFELPTFGVIVGVSLTVVQWRGLTLEEPPS